MSSRDATMVALPVSEALRTATLGRRSLSAEELNTVSTHQLNTLRDPSDHGEGPQRQFSTPAVTSAAQPGPCPLDHVASCDVAPPAQTDQYSNIPARDVGDLPRSTAPGGPAIIGGATATAPSYAHAAATPSFAQRVAAGARPRNATSRPPPTPAFFPGKDTAVLFPSIDGFTVEAYTRAAAALVGPRNVIAASRISHGRLCMYLATKAVVDEFLADHGGITVTDVFVPARRLQTPAERLVLSNVAPCIPHAVLEAEVARLYAVVSPMTFVSLGIRDPTLSHVISFRRQVYVVRNEQDVVPDSFLVNFDGESYRIFASFDDVRCFRCKSHGHLSRRCPTIRTDAPPAAVAQDFPPLITSPQRTPATPAPTPLSAPLTPTPAAPTPPPATPHAEAPSTDAVPDPPSDAAAVASPPDQCPELMDTSVGSPSAPPDGGRSGSPDRKKMRPDVETPVADAAVASLPPPTPISTPSPAPDNFETLFAPIQVFLAQNTDRFDLPFSDFLRFLRSVRRSGKPYDVARTFTDDVPSLIDLLTLSLPHLLSSGERALKARVARLAAALSKAAAYLELTGEEFLPLSHVLSVESLVG